MPLPVFPAREPGKPSGGQLRVHAAWNRKCELTLLLFIAGRAVLGAEHVSLSVRAANSEVTLCLGLPPCTALVAEQHFRKAPAPVPPQWCQPSCQVLSNTRSYG